MIEIRSADAMGDGLFATEPILRGTRIIAEEPMATMSPSDSDEMLFQHLTALESDKIRQLHKLEARKSHMVFFDRQEVRQWLKDQGATDASGSALKGKKLQDASKGAIKSLAIFRRNKVPMGSGMVGIFPLYSHVNHSCTPNAYKSWNPTLGRLTLHAISYIAPGEQITVSYTNDCCMSREDRQKQLAFWKFECQCQACVDPDHEIQRCRMQELKEGLEAFERSKVDTEMETGEENSPSGRATTQMPKTAADALFDAQKLCKLLEAEGFTGMELGKTYRYCAKYSLENGQHQRAIEYARSEYHIERALIGSDTEHLQEGMQGAKYWLKHLEGANQFTSKLRKTPTKEARKGRLFGYGAASLAGQA